VVQVVHPFAPLSGRDDGRDRCALARDNSNQARRFIDMRGKAGAGAAVLSAMPTPRAFRAIRRAGGPVPRAFRAVRRAGCPVPHAFRIVRRAGCPVPQPVRTIRRPVSCFRQAFLLVWEGKSSAWRVPGTASRSATSSRRLLGISLAVVAWSGLSQAAPPGRLTPRWSVNGQSVPPPLETFIRLPQTGSRGGRSAPP